jgi:hypothetical protein
MPARITAALAYFATQRWFWITFAICFVIGSIASIAPWTHAPPEPTCTPLLVDLKRYSPIASNLDDEECMDVTGLSRPAARDLLIRQHPELAADYYRMWAK